MGLQGKSFGESCITTESLVDFEKILSVLRVQQLKLKDK